MNDEIPYIKTLAHTKYVIGSLAGRRLHSHSECRKKKHAHNAIKAPYPYTL